MLGRIISPFMTIKIWVLFIVVALSNTIVYGTKYYVSTLGNDTQNGGTSTSSTWKTISKINSIVLNPGDEVLFNGGETFYGNLIINNSGNSTSNIKIGSYGTGKATINGGSGNGINLQNKAYVWIDNLIITGSWNANTQSGNDGNGIQFMCNVTSSQKLGDIKITYCEINGFKWAGVAVEDSSPTTLETSGYNNVHISKCEIYNNGRNGLVVHGRWLAKGSADYSIDSVYIGYNKAYSNWGLSSLTSSHSGSGIIVAMSGGGCIEHNITYNNGRKNGSSSGGPCGNWIYDSKNITMQYNESYNNETGGTNMKDGNGFDFDGGTVNCIFQYNYAHENYGAGLLICDFGNVRAYNSGNIVRYNVFQNNGYGGKYAEIAVSDFGGYGSVSNTLIYNNTCYNTNTWCVKDCSIDSKYYNNIFYSKSTINPVIKYASNAYFLNNDYYTSNGTLAAFYSLNRSNYSETTINNYSTLSNFRVSGNESYQKTNYGYDLNPMLSNPGNAGIIGNYDPNTLTEYKLSDVSPMVNTGFNLKLLNLNEGITDFNKISLPVTGNLTMGACLNENASGNLCANPGFETKAFFPWSLLTGNGTGGITTSTVKSGSNAGSVGNGTSNLKQTISGLLPNTDYNFSCYVNNSTTNNGSVWAGVKNYGGNELSTEVTDTNGLWNLVSINFTTGSTNNSAEIFLYCDVTNTYGTIDEVTVTKGSKFTEIPILLNPSQKLNVYPNPASSHATLEYTLKKEAIVKVEVYNMNGQKLYTTLKSSLAGKNKLAINIDDLSLNTGSYIIHLSSGGLNSSLLMNVVK
jgi:Secretion system C-terminal sorting domain